MLSEGPEIPAVPFETYRDAACSRCATSSLTSTSSIGEVPPIVSSLPCWTGVASMLTCHQHG